MTFSLWALIGLTSTLGISISNAACSFAKSGNGGEVPENHPGLGLRSLRNNPAAEGRMTNLLRQRQAARSLQTGGGCFTRVTYNDIIEDIRLIFEGMTDINTSRDAGHFCGGIVRLAAHDFMDYDQTDPISPQGANGCIDWNTAPGESGADNAGLETIWCDDHEVCPLKGLYDTIYEPLGISRADFWVVAANAVIKLTSLEWTDTEGENNFSDLDLPFRYGRVDLDDCTSISAHRLPGAQGCDQVEKTFITQMGLDWRDAVALLGAHTLGFGSTSFSGHDGMWVDEEQETITFDKRYYEEILRRAWRLRDPENNTPTEDLSIHLGAPKQDWTWAGPNDGNPRMMLNADICLAFDIDSGIDCCTRIREGPNNPGEVFCVDTRLNLSAEQVVGTITECASSAVVRPDARAAVDEFVVGLQDGVANVNGPFYEAFSDAWQRATEAGYPEGSLRPLADTCDPTAQPSKSPTEAPTPFPTAAPTTNSPTVACEDHTGTFVDKNNKDRTCDWVINELESRNRCKAFAYLCPETCGMCGGLLNNHACLSSEDCLSGICVDDGEGTLRCDCKSKNTSCSHSDECCSGECRGDETCADGGGGN